jgi:hypothetical protein
MDEQTVRQLQGAVELLRDGVQGAAAAIGTAQEEIAGIPYAVLRAIPVVKGPAAAAERAQSDITGLAYGSVRAVTGVTAAAALLLLKLHHLARAR